MKRLLTIFLLVFYVSTAFSGCIFLPAIEGFSQLGLSKSDRERLLPKAVKDFTTALYWNDPVGSSKFIKPETREKAVEDLRRGLDGVRVVESKMESVQYDADSQKADVRVNIKSFKVPFYVVEDHIYLQKWEFSVSDGWLFLSQVEQKKK